MSGLPIKSERANTVTHLAGAVFALSSIWMVWPAVHHSWQMAFGVLFFIVGMFIMFALSTSYHWVHPGRAKRVMRIFDHIGIYVMIACSYTPICVAVVGGWLGWTIFAVQWVAVLGGIFYKVFAMGRFPRLSLAIYLVMGWSVLLVFKPVMVHLSPLAIAFLVAEGLLYSGGTWFFAHDDKKHFHAIWHIFVLLGSMAHWSVVLCILLEL